MSAVERRNRSPWDCILLVRATRWVRFRGEVVCGFEETKFA